MNVIGKLISKLERETGVSKTGKTWEKQSILVEQNVEWNKEVVITFFGDKIKKIRDIEEGSDVNVSVNLSSREYNGKYFHNIDGWACAKLGQETVGEMTEKIKDMYYDDDSPF
tara:strand:- start:413 stop:751 length:339 start_codon:yes stop_codon:yes gene_type:complete